MGVVIIEIYIQPVVRSQMICGSQFYLTVVFYLFQYILESNFILSLAASWNRTFIPLLVANYSNLYGYCTDMSRGGFRGCSPPVGHKYKK